MRSIEKRKKVDTHDRSGTIWIDRRAYFTEIRQKTYQEISNNPLHTIDLERSGLIAVHILPKLDKRPIKKYPTINVNISRISTNFRYFVRGIDCVPEELCVFSI